MERRDEEHLNELIDLLEGAFKNIQIVQKRATEKLLLLRARCQFQKFQAIITEIIDSKGRNYSYYLLDAKTVIVGFDNSEDRRAQMLKYGKKKWKNHFKERVPHQHTYNLNFAP